MDLRLHTYVSALCRKSVLERLSPLITKEETKCRCNSGLKSNFNYCPLIIWQFRSSSDATKMKETQEKALMLMFDGYHLNYPTHYILEPSSGQHQ